MSLTDTLEGNVVVLFASKIRQAYYKIIASRFIGSLSHSPRRNLKIVLAMDWTIIRPLSLRTCSRPGVWITIPNDSHQKCTTELRNSPWLPVVEDRIYVL